MAIEDGGGEGEKRRFPLVWALGPRRISPLVFAFAQYSPRVPPSICLCIFPNVPHHTLSVFSFVLLKNRSADKEAKTPNTIPRTKHWRYWSFPARNCSCFLFDLLLFFVFSRFEAFQSTWRDLLLASGRLGLVSCWGHFADRPPSGHPALQQSGHPQIDLLAEGHEDESTSANEKGEAEPPTGSQSLGLAGHYEVFRKFAEGI